MENERRPKDKKVFTPKRPTCAGCLGDASVNNQPGWCVGCWPASPRPR